MSALQHLITEHIHIWTAADTGKKSGRGRASSNAGSVYGIKKLRELILELAVRGKLVPQDANDEPASELLKRIQAEKDRLVADGKIKKDKSFGLMTEEENPFELPHDWIWTRLVEITTGMDSGWSPACLENRSPADSVWGVLKTTSVQAMQYLDYENKELPEKLIPRPEAEVKVGDILVTRAGPTNRVAISCLVQNTRPKLMISDKIIRFHPIEIGIYGRYLALSLNAGATAAFLEKAKSGMAASQVNISQEKLRLAPIPIPPLKQQHRIVAKVDELMALCDQLEAQHNNAADAHEQLVSHLLSTLTQSHDAADFKTNWQLIATHFDTLFTTETSIDALKQTLLQLAVMGKLVPQDPKDESASELLMRIQAEKATLIAEGKIKKNNALPLMTDAEKPYELPERWTWVQWNEILAFDDAAFKRGPFGSSLTKGMFVESGYKVYEQYCPINDDCSFERYYITSQKFEEMKGFAVKSGDYLVSCSGVTLGRITQVPPVFKEGIINQALLRVRINHKYYDRNFFKLLFRSDFFQKQIFDNSTGSAIPNVKGVKDLKIMPVPLLDIQEQVRIVIKVDELMALCEQIKSRITEASLCQQKLADVIIANTA
ncbi:restriction endonuclease subunit S [Undibacterium sp.]|uniref:restriction endonuclease subunit S n=1 Tax=Undibacterium sp. TaxID=1914977 RepID=UPI00272FE519|nr:restriction endonuclease subunit S [Undibacterium sp.]MDP1977514.1 restriction endonuclease subunit S [Undibacterium sp.]